MAVLDTFFTLFKSSGVEDVEKNNERAKKANDKLEESLKSSRKTSDNLGRSFQGLGNELTRLATAGLTSAGVLAGFKKAVGYTIDLDQASRALSVNISELDAWGGAVQKTGGNVASFESSLRNLAMHLGTTGDVALKVLPQFADSFQKLGRYGSLKYGGMLGMDESLILLLQKGRREVEALIQQQKELGVVTKHDAEVARQFNWAWQNATRSLRTAVLETATAILPYLTKIFDGVASSSNYLRDHQAAISGALGAIGAAALYAARGFFTLRKAMIALIPVVGVVYEDLKAFYQGKDSFIGRLAAKSPRVYNEIKAWVQLGHDIKKAGKAVKDYFTDSNNFFSPVDHLRSNKTSQTFSRIAKSLGGGNSLTIDPTELDNLLPQAKAALGITTAIALPSSGSLSGGSTANRNISVNIGDINIQAQTNDVQSLTKAIDDTLKEQLRQALYNFDNGVLV